MSRAVEEFKKFQEKFTNSEFMQWGRRNWEKIKDELGIGATQKQMDYQTESMKMAHDLNQQSADVAWEREMEARGNQYQTAVQDMTKAGLNPVLALSGGAGVPTAQTSQVSAMSGSNGNSGKLLDTIASIVTTAMSVNGSITATAMKLAKKK